MTHQNTINVILVDDHRWVHELVAKILENEANIHLLGQGSHGLEAVQLCDQYQPDVILMDVVMPIMGGVEATRLLHGKYPNIKILVLSSFRDDESVRAMLDSGAVGYVLKDSFYDDLASTIRMTRSGKSVFSTEVSRILLQPDTSKPKLDSGLTRRELEILRLMAEGLTNPQIAQKLSVSCSTVKFHINNVLYKMGVETRAEAIVLAARSNLL